ncbi:FMN-binding glutamate synthase family protein [Demequina sp. NBRC 110055]|uniref:FMN-binding glutamate synthase family protein n=1 Tax=Demequina sp. NBRC 110055 TaxID=1570344 RepID=UPI00118568E7|nr:FMN-binding glutamate synthase family protein [Demequina sp. NBRC 110055]
MPGKRVGTSLTGAMVALGATAAVAAYDLLQRKHSVLHNYPVVGHLRYGLEKIRPEIQQYFIERDWDGKPFDRDTRSIIYERAKGTHSEKAYGTELDVYETGHEFLVHSTAPLEAPDEPPRVSVGGPDCAKPYSMSLLNVSSLSFGALSSNAIRALNRGAEKGGFAHDTGEGGISPYHTESNGDLVWEIGTGYFGCRTDDGDFDAAQFAQKAQWDQVKTVSLKLSQGAKPGIGGVLPGKKVTEEIAKTRGAKVGEKLVSPPRHRVFSTPTELIEFIARMRELSGGKPAGFKLCVSSRVEVLAMVKAMLEVGTAPDFIIVDGSEGGTGAAPLEYEDHMGMPLTDGLMLVHNALVGAGLRDRVRLGASGKVAAGNDIVKRLIQGADYTNAARPMMMATGCIQSQRCHLDTCPVGVATQDPRRVRALDVEDKYMRVYRYHKSTVDEAARMMASMGVRRPEELSPEQLRLVIGPGETVSYADRYDWLHTGELLSEAPANWARDWDLASADSFHTPHVTTRGDTR